jgi:cell division transport system ATP-binding protein
VASGGPLLCPAMAGTETSTHGRAGARRRRAAPRVTLPALPVKAPAPVSPPPRADTVVEFRGVSKLYGPGGVGLERATFAVSRQEFVFLVGATGSGKSTLMRLLIKELEPTEGFIRVAGRHLGEIDRKRIPYYRRNVGVVFQDFKLLPTRTVYDNIAYALQVTGARRRQIREKLPDILRLTGLSTKLHNYPHQLSGGEQQRVAVARAFAGHPPLLLADEPTGNLDPETSIGIMQLLYRINRAGTTVLVATHDNEMVDKMRRRVIELRRGRIVRDEAIGSYGPQDENTAELGQRLRRGLAPPEVTLRRLEAQGESGDAAAHDPRAAQVKLEDSVAQVKRDGLAAQDPDGLSETQ